MWPRFKIPFRNKLFYGKIVGVTVFDALLVKEFSKNKNIYF